jgi:ribonuclease HI
MDHRQTKPVFRFHPWRTPSKPMRAIQLILHAEVSYVPGQGLGIGIVHQAERVVEDGARKPRAGNVSNTKEKKYSVKGELFTAKNVKTRERAYMLALQHALGMAKSVIKKNGTKEGLNVEEVKIAISSPEVVETVNHHIQDSPESLKCVKKTNDRVMIQRVVRSVRKVFRRGVNVSITLADLHDTTVARAGARAKTLARQRGSKACKSRRQQYRAQNDDTTEDPNETGMEAM